MQLLIAIILSLFLASCGDPVECIDPDDFGNKLTMTIDSKNDYQKPIPNTRNFYVPWQSEYRLTGEDIVMIVKNSVSQTVNDLTCSKNFNESNTWSPLYGDVQQLKGKNKSLAQFPGNLPNPKWCGNLTPMENYNIPLSNFPSSFYMGMGLYACASKKAPDDQGLFCNKPESLIHIGDNACYNPTQPGCSTGFFSQGCPTGGMVYSPKECVNNCKLYLKIIDRYYKDNYGSYTIDFKKGVAKSEPGAISEFVSLVSSLMCKASRNAYNTIVKENDYIHYIRVLLVLYIIFTAISFLIGLLQITNYEFVIRILKIGLLTQLIASQTSWSFFSEYLFGFFQNGVNELTAIVFGAGGVVVDPDIVATANNGNAAAQGNSCIPNVAGMKVFDDFINRVSSYESVRKIFSLLTWKAYGFIFVLAILLVIFVILISIIKAILVFMVSYLAISILIVLAPIFIPFILFDITRSFFENWLKQMVSYFIQPLVILLFTFFVITLFNNEMEHLLGYRVCWKKWFTIPWPVQKDIYAWQYDYNTSAKECMLTPNSIYYVNNSGDVEPEPYPGTNSCSIPYHVKSSSTGNCDSYACAQNRYVGFPFLDPNFSYDQDRIKELQDHELMSFKDLLILLVLVWLMTRFNKVVPEIASNLAQTPMSYTSASNVAEGMQSGISNLLSKGGYALANPVYKSVTGREDLRDDYKIARKYISTTTGSRMGVGELGSSIYKAPGKLPLKALSTVGKYTIGTPIRTIDKAVSTAKDKLLGIDSKKPPTGSKGAPGGKGAAIGGGGGTAAADGSLPGATTGGTTAGTSSSSTSPRAGAQITNQQPDNDTSSTENLSADAAMINTDTIGTHPPADLTQLSPTQLQSPADTSSSSSSPASAADIQTQATGGIPRDSQSANFTPTSSSSSPSSPPTAAKASGGSPTTLQNVKPKAIARPGAGGTASSSPASSSSSKTVSRSGGPSGQKPEGDV